MSFEHKREERACIWCGFVRKVKVTYHQAPRQNDGSVPPLSITWEKLCGACQALQRSKEMQRRSYALFVVYRKRKAEQAKRVAEGRARVERKEPPKP